MIEGVGTSNQRSFITYSFRTPWKRESINKKIFQFLVDIPFQRDCCKLFARVLYFWSNSLVPSAKIKLHKICKTCLGCLRICRGPVMDICDWHFITVAFHNWGIQISISMVFKYFTLATVMNNFLIRHHMIALEEVYPAVS